MTPSEIAVYTQQFYSLLSTAAEQPRLGGKQAEALLGFFNNPEIKNRFVSAPASTALRFHHAFEGGLLVHTLEVFRAAQLTADSLGSNAEVNGVHGWLFKTTFMPYFDLLAATMLHDLNKIGDASGNLLYVPNMIKNGTVRSDKIPYATSDKVGSFFFAQHATAQEHQADFLASQGVDWVPDGLISLSLVKAYSPVLFDCLRDDVKFAIKHHDGAYGKGRRDLAGNETPLQMLLHFADMWSSRGGKQE